MKNLIFIMAILGFMSLVQAEETVTEKTKETAHDVKRASKKGMHRVEEATCVDSDIACAAKKGTNRAEEGADYLKDKTNEATDKSKGK